ncbi:MAG: gamma-glutamyltransferase [Methylocystis sp.]|nr:gamma-glutamyltransferase [Methylocystis sp.]MCA3584573.1 gamma-glutamyltransferase [Methylocystis sp.]MCA3588603.1 gamma-glutamyltransferase [Methylocystis sp.]MCA3591328.1 gamma-glutamyltransferase [Methylocystis sp.]
MTSFLSRRSLIASLLASTALPSVAFAQAAAPQPIISDWPRRQPVFATGGMVASQEALATRIGAEVLEQGGNAVDAAVAVAFALAVTLPRAGNIGGGGFMIVHRADHGQTKAIDFRETAPASMKKDVYLNEKGEADLNRSQNTGLGVGIPGTVAGMALALEKYGSGKYTLARLLSPAIQLAADGFLVGDDLAFSLKQAETRLRRFEASARIFLTADGAALPRGANLQQVDLARSLSAIAADGPKAFYEGPIAEKMVASVNAAGGNWTLADLKNYRAVERDVVKGAYRGHEIVSMPPPSSGGVHLIQILNILEGFDLKAAGQNSADSIHLFAEASKLAYADRSEYLGDPDFVQVPVRGLTSKKYAETLRAQIDPAKARPGPTIKPGKPQPFESDQTTHFSVIDKDGNAVACTYTLNFSYGVGMVADGTGILMNNELDDFAAKPGVPNAYGLVGGDANAPGAGKRPLSSMSPTIVFKDGKPFLVTGSPGGSRIITTVLQVLMNVIDHGMNVAEATEAVRVHHQWLPDELRVERGLSADTIRLLRARGHKVEIRQAMGSTQSILLTKQGFEGASDLRQAGTLTAGVR